MKKTTNTTLIASILVAALLIAGAMVFLGAQLGKKGDSNALQTDIKKGIETYVQKQQEQATNRKVVAVNPTVISGDYSDDDPFMGKKNAPVTLIEWSDFQCPFCRKFFNDTLPKIKEKYIDTGKLKFVYRDFPLSFHPNAIPMAIAADCAREQGGDKTFFAYHDKIFEGQNALGNGTVNLPRSELKQYAVDLGLKRNQFNDCLDTQKYRDEVMKDFADGQKVGVRGTPGFLLNGRSISGAQPVAVFEAAIESALNK